MRTNWFAFLFFAVSAFGQTTNLPFDTLGSTAETGMEGRLSTEKWRAGQRDWCSTEWISTELVTNQVTGRARPETRRFIQVGDGLNYLSPEGTWQTSVDAIEIMTNGGAAALRGPTKVYFPPTLADPITIITRSNIVLRARPAGVYYTDYASGQSVLLGAVRAAEGELVPPNQIIYRSAVKEGLQCDIRLTYTKGAFESDLVIIERPELLPETLHLIPETTRLELVTLMDGREPRQVSSILQREADPIQRERLGEFADLVDQTLDYGPELRFPVGRAFSTVDSDPQTDIINQGAARIHLASPQEGELSVAKTWTRFGEQRALVEAVWWRDIKPMLDSLPPVGRSGAKSMPTRHASLQRELPLLSQDRSMSPPPDSMLIASSSSLVSGLI